MGTVITSSCLHGFRHQGGVWEPGRASSRSVCLQWRFFASRLPAYKDLKTDIFPTDTIFLYMSGSLKKKKKLFSSMKTEKVCLDLHGQYVSMKADRSLDWRGEVKINRD